MKIEMINLDKKDLKVINANTKYVLISNSYSKIKSYLSIKIKPLLILYNGSYVVDLENNSVIINKSINIGSLNNIINYSKLHGVDIKYYKYRDVVYGLKLGVNNYHRRLIIPYMFKDLYPNVKCETINKDIYINDSKVSLLNAIEETLDYLHVKNNYIELENIYINVSDIGYCNNILNMGGFELYES